MTGHPHQSKRGDEGTHTTTSPAELRILDTFDDALDVLKVCVDVLAGDGSTGTMPDVSPADAATWILCALHEHGYVLGKTA